MPLMIFPVLYYMIMDGLIFVTFISIYKLLNIVTYTLSSLESNIYKIVYLKKGNDRNYYLVKCSYFKEIYRGKNIVYGLTILRTNMN